MEEYVKVIDDLIINDEFRLTKQVGELKQQDEYQKYVIDKKMQEKDEQIKALQESIKLHSDTVNRALVGGDQINKIIYDDNNKGIVKAIELKSARPSIIATANVIPSTTSSSSTILKKSPKSKQII